MQGNKGDISLQLEDFFSPGGANIQKQLKYFSNTNISTTLKPPGRWVSQEAKLSTEFEFDGLVG